MIHATSTVDRCWLATIVPDRDSWGERHFARKNLAYTLAGDEAAPGGGITVRRASHPCCWVTCDGEGCKTRLVDPDEEYLLHLPTVPAALQAARDCGWTVVVPERYTLCSDCRPGSR